MLLPIRPIAIRCAVYFFFAVAILGTFSGISPLTCSKRGMVGAMVVYLAANLLLKAVNVILTNAVVERYVEENEGLAGDHEN
ncbi:MAG: hypothetical protein IIC50_03370 [Planctomycetes bacterium]|nr:hypothetical protein [Planctomycetota bacterium]